MKYFNIVVLSVLAFFISGCNQKGTVRNNAGTMVKDRQIQSLAGGVTAYEKAEAGNPAGFGKPAIRVFSLPRRIDWGKIAIGAVIATGSTLVLIQVFAGKKVG